MSAWWGCRAEVGGSSAGPVDCPHFFRELFVSSHKGDSAFGWIVPSLLTTPASPLPRPGPWLYSISTTRKMIIQKAEGLGKGATFPGTPTDLCRVCPASHSPCNTSLLSSRCGQRTPFSRQGCGLLVPKWEWVGLCPPLTRPECYSRERTALGQRNESACLRCGLRSALNVRCAEVLRGSIYWQEGTSGEGPASHSH